MKLPTPCLSGLDFCLPSMKKKGANCFRTILKLLKQLIDENFIAT